MAQSKRRTQMTEETDGQVFQMQGSILLMQQILQSFSSRIRVMHIEKEKPPF